jgi:hypothetical protein
VTNPSSLRDVIALLERGCPPREIAEDLRRLEDFSDALNAVDGVLLGEQARLLRECRAGIDALLAAKPALAGFTWVSGTLGNLRTELHEQRPSGVMNGPGGVALGVPTLTWGAAMKQLEDWMIAQSGPLVGLSFSQEDAQRLVAAASVVGRKAEQPNELSVRLFESASGVRGTYKDVTSNAEKGSHE